MNILQTKIQFKNRKNNKYYLYYTVNKNTDDKEIVNNKNEDDENDYINYIELISPNHYIGIRNDNVLLN